MLKIVKKKIKYQKVKPIIHDHAFTVDEIADIKKANQNRILITKEP